MPASLSPSGPSEQPLARTVPIKILRGIMIAWPWECDAAKAIIFRSRGVDLFESCFSAGPHGRQAGRPRIAPSEGPLYCTLTRSSNPPAPVSARLRATLDRLQRIAQCLHLSFERQARLAFLAQNLAPAVAVDADRDNHRDSDD